MTIAEGVASILLWAANIALLWMIFRFWRDHRVDALRHRLFVLRDELFDYALDGNLSFEAPAYKMLHLRMNNLLRFAHKIGFMRLLILFLFRRKVIDAGIFEDREREWQSALGQLSAAQRKKIEDIHGRVLREIPKHMVFGAFALFFLLGNYFLWSRIRASLLQKARVVEIEAQYAAPRRAGVQPSSTPGMARV